MIENVINMYKIPITSMMQSSKKHLNFKFNGKRCKRNNKK